MKTSRYRIAREADSQNPIIKYIEQVPIVGDVNVDTFLFEFDSEWEGFEKTLVLNIDGKCYADHIDSNNEVILRKEVYNAKEVTFGVYGIKGTGQNKSILSTPTVYMETLPSTWGQIGDIEDLPDRDTWNLYTQEMLALVAEGKLSAQECETILQDIRAIQTAINTTAGNVDSDKQDVARMKQEIAEIIAAAKLKISEYNANAAEVTAEFNRNANSWQVAINQAGNTQVGEVEAEGTTQIGKVADEGIAQKKVVSDEGTLQKGIVETAGTNAVSAIETAKNTAVQKVQEEGATYNNRITTLEEVRAMAEKNFNTSNAVIEGGGQVTNALYWNVKRVNKFGGGEVTQDTTEGKQLVDFGNLTASSGNTSVNFENDILTVSGTNNNYAFGYKDITDLVKNNPDKKIAMLYENINADNQFGTIAQVRITYNDSTPINYKTLLSHGTVRFTYQIPSDTSTISFARIEVYANNSSTAQDSSVVITKPMIYFGNIDDDIQYEKYTGGTSSPNPDYEQPVKMLTGEVSVEESNKNILKYRDDLPSTYTTDGITYTVNTDGSIHVKGTSTSSAHGLWLNTITLEPGTYTRSKSIQTTNVRVQCRKNNDNGMEIFGDNTAESKTITLTEKTMCYTRLLVSNGVTVDETVYPMIEKAPTASTYAKNEGQTFSLTLPEGMYLGDLGTASNFIFKNEKNSPYYNSELVEDANYWHKGWNKKIYNGTENTWAKSSNTSIDKFILNSFFTNSGFSSVTYTNYFKKRQSEEDPNLIGKFGTNDTQFTCNFSEYGETTLEAFKTWLSTHNLEMFGELTTPQNILITDTTLNTQLDTMWEQMKTYGITNFTITGGDIAGKLDLDYYVDDRIEQNQEIADIKSALLSLGANI